MRNTRYKETDGVGKKKKREIEKIEYGDRRRRGTRLAWISPSRGHRDVSVWKGGRRRRRQRRWWFYARFTSPDTTMTCARDDGRDDTAPYWTALRKYNGAPLLRSVHPNLDVGVGAAPLPRSERVYASSPLDGAGRLFFLSFYLSSSTALVCPPRRPPFNSPGVLAGASPLLSPTILAVLFLFFLLYRRGYRATLRVSEMLPNVFYHARHGCNGALPVHIDGYFRSRSKGAMRRERLVPRERALPFSLASLFSPSSHPVHPSVLAAEVIAVEVTLASTPLEINALPSSPPEDCIFAGWTDFNCMTGF